MEYGFSTNTGGVSLDMALAAERYALSLKPTIHSRITLCRRRDEITRRKRRIEEEQRRWLCDNWVPGARKDLVDTFRGAKNYAGPKEEKRKSYPWIKGFQAWLISKPFYIKVGFILLSWSIGLIFFLSPVFRKEWDAALDEREVR